MRIAIAVKEDLGPGYLANASACIASGLFHQEKDLIGQEIEGEYVTYIPITKIPMLIVKRNGKPWKELLTRAKRGKLKYMLFTKEAQSTTNYAEYVERVEGKPIDAVDILGIGVLGEDAAVSKFSGDLPLLK